MTLGNNSYNFEAFYPTSSDEHYFLQKKSLFENEEFLAGLKDQLQDGRSDREVHS